MKNLEIIPLENRKINKNNLMFSNQFQDRKQLNAVVKN